MIDFLGIGAQRAGTSWLFERLRLHPQVSFPGGKEVHFWDRYRHLGVQHWGNLFSGSDLRRKGEITPAYAILDGPTVREVYGVCPDAALFMSLRNPLERTWSAALMLLKRGMIEYHEVSDQWFIDVFRSQQSVRRSDYIACIDTWTSIFPPDRLHIMWFDDIITEPRAVLQALAKHIDVDPRFYDSVPTEKLTSPVHEGLKLPIRKNLLGMLQDTYLPQIEILAKRFDRDLRKWTEWQGSEQAAAAGIFAAK